MRTPFLLVIVSWFSLPKDIHLAPLIEHHDLQTPDTSSASILPPYSPVRSDFLTTVEDSTNFGALLFFSSIFGGMAWLFLGMMFGCIFAAMQAAYYQRRLSGYQDPRPGVAMSPSQATVLHGLSLPPVRSEILPGTQPLSRTSNNSDDVVTVLSETFISKRRSANSGSYHYAGRSLSEDRDHSYCSDSVESSAYNSEDSLVTRSYESVTSSTSTSSTSSGTDSGKSGSYSFLRFQQNLSINLVDETTPFETKDPPNSPMEENVPTWSDFPVLPDFIEFLPSAPFVGLVPSNALNHLRKIGNGMFGRVDLFRTSAPESSYIAIKTTVADPYNLSKLLMDKEIRNLLAIPRHENIVKFIGYQSGPVSCVAMEYCDNTDLLDYMDTARMRVQARNACPILMAEISLEMENISRQICAGMAHLQDHGWIHRDLAARNVLLTRNLHAKVADFGSAGQSDLGFIQTDSAAYAWFQQAPECLSGGIFSFKSDVWAFGCLFYELISFGIDPFLDVHSCAELYGIITSGVKPQVHPVFTSQAYGVVLRCLTLKPEFRPTFRELMQLLEGIRALSGQWLYGEEPVGETAC